MKINRLSSPGKKITLITGAVLIVAFAYGAYANGSGLWPFTKDEQSKAQQSQTQEPAADQTTNLPEDTVVPTDETSPKTPTQTEEEPKNSSVRASITSANQNGSKLQIRTLIETLSSEGTCTLTLEKDDTKVTRTAGIQTLANSSTCKGFDEPVANLSPGTWNASIIINLPSGEIKLTKKVTIN